MQIKSLTNASFDDIYSAFADAFSDYDVQVNKTELSNMLKRRGFDKDASFAAFDGNKIVAFTLNGVGLFNNIKTAYDTGTGTTKEYRGQGLAAKIFEYSLAYLKEMGIKQYLLEVLQHNRSAIKIYKKMGFEVTREFNYFKQEKHQIENRLIKNDFVRLIETKIEDIEQVIHFYDFSPSWQNNIESIKRDIDKFTITGAYSEGSLLGFSVFESDSGDLTQIAVDPEHRRKGIGSLLLQEILTENKHHILKIVNTETTCDSITDFLKAHNIEISGKQFEMMREV